MQNQRCLYVVVSLENLSIFKITPPTARLSRKILKNFLLSGGVAQVATFARFMKKLCCCSKNSLKRKYYAGSKCYIKQYLQDVLGNLQPEEFVDLSRVETAKKLSQKA